ncbi:hypothetical protein CONPUDRAFT_120295 [Coniophora puteana RWD-64-598 SS2]|uniref:Uncharacterized protein n=1 Tax=Coniophora puteana (strain RWD-64-598) TaxID=741705 RepID=A0A5M3N045_CONPW|nr:uncharacterized protein CONPUDRAFT_120295 [Coniophora puteana RWD-64-598 SS2]EIW84424.1 hypothetical protein CONPUDRAFT_120295 [Coniophora puteana RWD-64-598 SS2]
MLKQLLDSNPGIQVTPNMLLQFVAARTKQSPTHQNTEFDLSPPHSPRMGDDDHTLPLRGRMPTREDDEEFEPQSRSSSKSSTGTSRAHSRPPSATPQTPTSGNAFDKRQRTTPLTNRPPSSWQRRPAPANRRRSSSAMSDEESSDTSFGQTSTPGSGRKSRRPSGSSSVTASPNSAGTFSPSPSTAATSAGSPSPTWDRKSRSRPHSRTQSYNPFTINVPPSPEHGEHGDHSSSDEPGSPLDQTPDSSFEYPSHASGNSFTRSLAEQVSSLPMPRMSGDSDNDSDEEDEVAAGLVLDRSTASSTVSLEPQERLEALQKANTDMSRKLAEAERTLQKKLLEHELDMEEMQSKLDELKSELTATKREEKELRAKERTNSTQLASLEQEVAKLNKALDNARTAYQSLQKQYQEQCNESERYRNTLRRRDQEIKDMQDAAGLQQIEQQKWLRERDSYDSRIAAMEEDLLMAQQAHAQLDEQKQENLMLKETIDRLRYDMDEMRNNASQAAAAAGAGSLSARNSMSKSLGAELMKMKDWGMPVEEDMMHDVGHEGIEVDVHPEEDDGDDTEGEDVVEHHVITRTKRRIGGRKTETLRVTETKEYTEVAIQHEPSLSTCEIQTDPEPRPVLRTMDVQTDEPPVTPTASMEIQTDEEPITPTASTEIQTEPEYIPPPKVTASIEIQTDEPEPTSEPTTSDDEETLTSSSATALPPTPKQAENDLPPSYNQVEEQETEEEQEQREWRVVSDTLKKFHRGMQIPLDALPQGISEDAVEEWRALKEELGVECAVIDKLVEASPRTGRPRRSSSSASGSAPGRSSRRNRFYNIYNTYVYGASKDASDPSSASNGMGSTLGAAAKQLLVGVGASAFVFLAMSPYLSPNASYANHYAVPGGPTYYDRAAWSGFNSMQPAGEGFGFDGTAALWNIIGRVGVGAARIAGGFPT